MKFNIKNRVTLLVSVWMMSFTMNMLEGVCSIPSSLEVFEHHKNVTGKKWAVLVAGSNGYENYRHQADVCHAYQILKRGGLEDDNIIVFMYDDIAHHPKNPRPGIIINEPNGSNVYDGVPKDYTGEATNAQNFYAVISGNRSALSGGSGKVVDSGPNDTIFIYYSDHGSTGLVSMPEGDDIMANDFMDVLMEKHATNSYKKMVIYLEACESGSMFEGILPNNINIYATTASKASEDSWAFYCPDYGLPPPPEYTTCLGDLYSISWLEDSDKNDMTKETLQQQYQIVRRRTLIGYKDFHSHVMKYGDDKLKNDLLANYIGANPSLDENAYSFEPSTTQTRLVNQRDAHLLHLRLELQMAPEGSKEKLKARQELVDEISHREHVDNTFHLIWDLLRDKNNNSTMMLNVRPPGKPLVDDWDCFRTLIKTYENHCGRLSSYGKKYTRVFANMCNAGIYVEQLKATTSQVSIPLTSSSTQTLDLSSIGSSFPTSATLQELELVTSIDEELLQEYGDELHRFGKVQRVFVVSLKDRSSHMLAMTTSFLKGDYQDELRFFRVHKSDVYESQVAVTKGIGKYDVANGYAEIKVVDKVGFSTKGGKVTNSKFLLFHIYLS
ncbi:hypothetical protein VNO78_16318 [Psophocarpus tetragonolobus]|uniref:Legumain prodomain domain-containing protein n=1 Tax=Psophocarpus tetragonolobus TaxID=3891 RepID=A0AAN9SGZ0_PSOTE